ncbi:kekkon 2 [Carabus blaptoides fortunei]
MYSRLVTVMALVQWLATATGACPVACICKWKGGKQTVECTNKDLITLPDGMDPGTQVLEFSGNNLQTLPRERFQRMELINLQRIYLSRCRITGVDDRAFKGLTNLVELDLSENLLTSVPTETFADYPSLMRLILNNNHISVLHRAAFNHLTYLTTLELSACEIELIEDEAFVGLDNLEWLKLDGNRLNTIRGQHILPESLHGIDLNRNSWQCDCRMLDLHSWLHNFNNIPHTVEPTCSGPPRLTGRNIRSIDVADFACLPDVSPTTLYLEIGEGKNVSLLCKVTAVPEAHVSWWFQGQVLQNDSIIAPGLHLYYYIEDGSEEKRSELFIYNTNTEDNGTFICVAENSAGRIQSNFTIRVIVKEEPIVIIVSFPYEYLLAITAGISVLIVVLIITIIVSIVKCRRNRRRRKKKERSKEVALHNQTSTTKCSVLRETVEEAPEPVKVNGNAVMTERQQEMIIFAATTGEEIINSVTPASCSNQFRSPPSVKSYPTEQNPDLINDTESVGKGRRREGDGEDERDNSGHSSYQEAMENVVEEFDGAVNAAPVRQVQWQDLQFPARMGSRELYQHTADVHLSPGCLLDNEGYPVDYGLPKVVLRPQMSNDHFYRTLPHNRTSKRISAANPVSRYSREAEFLSRSSQQPASYEHYCSPDVRYTVDGYPRAHPAGAGASNYPEANFIPSPPEAYKTDSPSSLPCCGSPPREWPPCMPAGLHLPSHEGNQSRFASISKRCVSAQTECGAEDDEPYSAGNSRQASSDQQQQQQNTSAITGQQQPQQQSATVGASLGSRGSTDPLTESPDEGYVGEGAESAEI